MVTLLRNMIAIIIQPYVHNIKNSVAIIIILKIYNVYGIQTNYRFFIQVIKKN